MMVGGGYPGGSGQPQVVLWACVAGVVSGISTCSPTQTQTRIFCSHHHCLRGGFVQTCGCRELEGPLCTQASTHPPDDSMLGAVVLGTSFPIGLYSGLKALLNHREGYSYHTKVESGQKMPMLNSLFSSGQPGGSGTQLDFEGVIWKSGGNAQL
eukprot:1159874-Pelagomonas_calceolata.AAC.4